MGKSNYEQIEAAIAAESYLIRNSNNYKPNNFTIEELEPTLELKIQKEMYLNGLIRFVNSIEYRNMSRQKRELVLNEVKSINTILKTYYQ